MKIIHPLLCYYPSQAGGPANTLYWLNNALDSNAYSCKILATQFGLVKKNPSMEFKSNHIVTFFKSSGLKFIVQSITELKIADIVQFSSLFFAPTLPILIAAIRKDKVIIISPRGELHDSALNKNSFRKAIWLKIIKQFQKHINFHATSQYEKKLINAHFPNAKSVTVIPNFIELPKRLSIKTNSELNLVFVGRINPIKNIDVLIQAFGLLKKVHNLTKIQLFIIGSARLPYETLYEAELKELVKKLNLQDDVIFIGHLEGQYKEQIIASGRALILPSKSENFGNVVLEALAHGTPVIASKNTPWEELETSQCGYWIDITAESLMRTMSKLINMPENEYNNMRENAYTLCKSKFDIQTNVQVWETYYKTITNHVKK